MFGRRSIQSRFRPLVRRPWARSRLHRARFGVMRMSAAAAWPPLPYSAWKATCETLHLWTQIVGKIRLVLTPWLNHSWHVPLYVTARGLSTSVIPYRGENFEIQFDFI